MDRMHFLEDIFWRFSPRKQREYMGVFISIYMIDTPVAKGGLLTTCFHPADCYSWTFPQSALLKVPLGCFDAWYTKMASSSCQFWQSIFRGGLPMGHQSIRVMCGAKINRKRVVSWFVGFPTVRQNPPIQRFCQKYPMKFDQFFQTTLPNSPLKQPSQTAVPFTSV